MGDQHSDPGARSHFGVWQLSRRSTDFGGRQPRRPQVLPRQPPTAPSRGLRATVPRQFELSLLGSPKHHRANCVVAYAHPSSSAFTLTSASCASACYYCGGSWRYFVRCADKVVSDGAQRLRGYGPRPLRTPPPAVEVANAQKRGIGGWVRLSQADAGEHVSCRREAPRQPKGFSANWLV
jgi:hypothetical protein